MAGSDDSTLMKVAIFGFAMSIFCTAGLTLMLSDGANSDYSFDQINQYRDDLSAFTGESMLSETPWVLTGAYTAWSVEDGYNGHVADGWLYGESLDITQYYDDSPAIFHMDPEQKSSRTLSVGGTESVTYASGIEWWYDWPIIRGLAQTFGISPIQYSTMDVSTWSHTGVRYVLDPTLPFLQEDGTTETSTRDGSLSLVWYKYGQTEGISGGLDIYGGDVLLASYTATDIIAAYSTSSGYASSYDFDFGGVMLNMAIRFNPEAIESGVSLMEAWTTGQWEIAITSTGAGLFLDVQNSNSYSVSVGSMIQTFSDIYTFSLPNVDNDLLSVVLWLMVGLPMTLALALVLIRITSAVHIL